MENNSPGSNRATYTANTPPSGRGPSPTPLFASAAQPPAPTVPPAASAATPLARPANTADLAPLPAAPPPSAPSSPTGSRGRKKLLIRAGVTLLLVALTGAGIILFNVLSNRPSNNTQATVNSTIENTTIPLSEFAQSGSLALLGAQSLSVNGQLRANESFILAPQAQPTASRSERGQLYYDNNTNQLAYYNGTQYIALASGDNIVQSFQGQSGAVTLVSGNGITISGTTLTNSGVTSFGGQTGDIAVGSGLTMNGATLQNTGIVSAASGTPGSLSVVNDGNGNLTISSVGAGTGTVTSGGGTTGRIPLFTSSQNIEDSVMSQSGSTVTVAGNLSVTTGGLSLSSALTVANGGTGATSLTANGVLIGNGAGAVTTVTAGAANLCLVSTVGAPTFTTCPSASGVTSLNGLSGGLTIANASGASSTITIDNASTSTKGIAQFNATNFSDNGAGTINTIQNINTGASPTFVGVNTNAITPSATLTVGATGQQLTLQGNASTRLTATGGGFTTTVGFTGTPTGAVTYNFDRAAAAGTYTICSTVGNCANAGGGVTTTGGTAGKLAVFTGLQSIGDSIITQGSGTIDIAGSLTLGSALGVPYGGTGLATTPSNGQLLIGNGTTYTLATLTNNGGLTITNSSGGIGLAVNYGATSTTAVRGDTALTCPSGTGNVTGGGNSITLGSGGSCTSLNTVTNPTFNTSVTTPTVQNAGLTLAATGANSLLLNTNGSTRLTIADTGNITASNNLTIQGGSATIGTSSQAGSLVIHDGASRTATLQVTPLGQNTVYTLPDPGVASTQICLTSGNCAGLGGGVITAGGATNRVAKFTASGTINNSTITDDGSTVTTSVGLVVQGGGLTVGTTGQLGSLVLHDGNGQNTSLQAGDSSGNLTFVLPATAGTGFQCLKKGTGNQLIWDTCLGGGGGTSGVTSLNSLAGALVIQGTANQITVGDNGSTTITLSLPQDIATSSSPTFANLTLSGDIAVNGGDITTTAASTAPALAIKPGDSSASNGTGSTVTITGGTATSSTCGTACTGGNVVLQGGTATGGSGTRAGGNVTIDAGVGATSTGSVNIGSTSATVNVGSSSTAGTVSLQAATGGVINVANNGTTGSVQIGNTTGSVSQTIAIGNNATASSTSTVTLGSLIGSSTTTLQAGTGNLNLATNSASASIIAKSNTNGTTAFEVLNSTNVPQFVVDTSNSRTYIGNPTGDTTGALLVLDTKTGYTGGANSTGEPTGVAGGMYYNSAIGQFRCYELDHWRDCLESARNSWHVMRDFMGTQSDNEFGTDTSGGGGLDNSLSGETNHPGIVRISVSSVNQWAFVGAQNSNSKNIRLGNGDYWRLESGVRITALSTAAQRFTYRTGFLDNVRDTGASNLIQDGCYMRYNDANTANWQGVCRASGTESTCDTGVAVVAGTWYRTVIVARPDNTATFTVYTNGSTTGTSCPSAISTNFPSGSTQVTSWGNEMSKELNNSAVTADMDFIDVSAQFGTSR